MESSSVTVTTVRPLKLVGLLFAIFGLALILVALSASYWVDVVKEETNLDDQTTSTGSHYQGLWQVCTHFEYGSLDIKSELECSNVEYTHWMGACRAFVFIPLFINIFSIITACFAYSRKISFYIPGISSVVAGFLLLLPLIIYPAEFQFENIAKRLEEWELGWTYGAGWGALAFLVAAGILMIFGRKDESQQKTYYTSNY